MTLNPSITARHKALLQVNKVALSGSTLGELFGGMCQVLGKMLTHDCASLSIYDAEHDSLKIAALCGAREHSVFHVGFLLHRKTSQTGWVFEHQRYIIRGDLGKEPRFPADKLSIDEGYRSLCGVPLIVWGNTIGVVTIASEQKNKFSTGHALLLQEISNQIALGVNSISPRCPNHPKSRLVCPRCIGAVGGKTTVSKHRENLSTWGKKGGRGRRKPDSVE